MTVKHATDPSAEIDHQPAQAAALRASGRVPASGELPRPGELLRDFTLPATDGTVVPLSALREQRSLVLIFAGAPPLDAAVTTLVNASREFEAEDANLVTVLAASPAEAREIRAAQSWPVTVLADEDTAIHRRAGAERSACAVYVTDRFGEIFAAWRTAAGEPLPSPPEVTRYLRQIGLLCPECGFPEWPMD